MPVRPLLRLASAGDQHPVLILPGFGADDGSAAPLHWTRRGQGYWVHVWRLGRNIAPTAHAVQGVRHRIAALHRGARHEGDPRRPELGRRVRQALRVQQPTAVRQVITLGSPYCMGDGDRGSVPRQVWKQLQRLHDGDLGYRTSGRRTVRC